MSEEMKVYLVETVDDLLENWFPTSVYLHRESAENCAESLRCDDGYIRQFARVVEMKVADTEACHTDADGPDCGHVRNSSAYEAGYRDGSVHYELEHCPACKNVADLQEALEENAKLRERTELLVTLLRNDCDIEASWDGLRHFWSIGLTEDGCLMRDRACKAEAENAKLRELVRKQVPELCEQNAVLCHENAKLRELVGDIWEFGFSNSAGANSVKEWYRVRDELEQRVYAALGVEVDG